jgi:hypothetical protein
MKTWKIFKAGSNTIAYVNVNEKDPRDTMYYALQLARKYYNDYSISGTQLLAENEDKQENILVLELYYPETFTFDGIDYILGKLNCALWTNEAHGFCKRSDGSEGLYLVDFNNKQELLPVSVGMPV